MGFPGGSDLKESACNAGDASQTLDWEDPLEKGMATHSSILAGEFHEQWSLVGYSPWDPKEWDTTERLSMHTCKQRINKLMPFKRHFFFACGPKRHSIEQRGKKIRLLLTYVKINFSPLLCTKGTNWIKLPSLICQTMLRIRNLSFPISCKESIAFLKLPSDNHVKPTSSNN